MPVMTNLERTPTQQDDEDEVVQQVVCSFVEPIIEELEDIVEEHHNRCLRFGFVAGKLRLGIILH